MPEFNTEALSLFVGEQLVAQAKTVYEEHLPPLSSEQLVPSQGGDLGASEIAREVYQHVGRAQTVADAADDLPVANAGVIRDLYKVAMGGVAYRYNLREIRAAMFAGRPLDAKRAQSARRAILEYLNDVFFVGDVQMGVYGLLRFPYIPRPILDLADFQPGAAVGDTLAALYSLENQIRNQSSLAETPTHLLLPPAIYQYVAQTSASSIDPFVTILEVYKRNAQYAKTVLEVREFAGAGPAGEDLIACLSLGSPELAEHLVPDPLTILPVQERNLASIVNMVCESAGFVTEFPLAHVIAEVS
jgi:hypothetical protein